MMKRPIVALSVLMVLLTACIPTPPLATLTPTPTRTPVPLDPTPGRVLISEVLPGVPGDNNREFIELYNAGTEAVDLQGWSLSFILAEGEEEKTVYRWDERADVPGYGHFLLVLEGAQVGAVPDVNYAQPIFGGKGGLALRDASGAVVDAVGWGKAPSEALEGDPAPSIEEGASLERLPGTEEGNAVDTQDNAADFALNPSPDPQNTGSPLTPLPQARLDIDLLLPERVEPGKEFELQVGIENRTGQTLQDVVVSLALPEEFEVVDARTGDGEMVLGEELRWTIDELGEAAKPLAILNVRSPWTYLRRLLRNAFVDAANWPLRAYAGPRPLVVEGGAIPVATARTLLDEEVVVEGIATMYTGGFYAGGGKKFYLEDETGGVQVYCPDGQGEVEVRIGQRVRVQGEVQLYRNAVEVVPAKCAAGVEVLDSQMAELTVPQLPIPSLGEDEGMLGRVASFEGTLTRLEEFNYSYEMDLMDDEGYTALVYLEKDTGVNVEALEEGKRYQITGVVEVYMDKWQIKPRIQADLVEIYPPELALELTAPNHVSRGDAITYTITAYNHTDTTLNNVFIAASVPASGVVVEGVLDGGVLEGGEAVWTLGELEAHTSASVRYVARVNYSARDQILSDGVYARADEWPDAAVTPPYITFVGTGVPIWALQGPGTSSPYVRSIATTEGVITAIFPELGGFWIQSLRPDDDPATSEGLFVTLEELGGWQEEVELATGDVVLVTGRVRELSGQTALEPQAWEEVEVVRRYRRLPSPVELYPPQDEAGALVYYESLEGMLVEMTEPAVVVAPTTKYGEYALVWEEWGVDRVMHGNSTGMLIFVDDGSAVEHEDRTTLPYAVKTGDKVTGLRGPLSYTYGNYKIQPVVAPTVSAVERPLPRLQELASNEFSIATFNAENLFDYRMPNPSDPPLPSPGEYRDRLAKAADVVVRAGLPTIVALQEVENVEVLEDLASEEALAPYDYQPLLIEGLDSRGIDVGYLVRRHRAQVVDLSARPAPGGLTSRPPLLLTVTLETAGAERTLYVINNHFTSMAAGEEATEPRRMAQAEWNAEWVAELLAEEPEALVAVVGDLNSYYRSPPLDRLREVGLRHVYESVEPQLPYTYIYQGKSETLDHILVSLPLYDLVKRVDALHVNADYPLRHPDDLTAERASDHDPLIAVFALR